MKDVVIVGNGLFGSIAATLARSRGHKVTIVSNMEPLAASKASGCVLAPSWLGSLSPQQVEVGLRVLSELYVVHPIAFTGPLGASFKAQRVDPDAVLLKPDIVDNVERAQDGRVTLSKTGEVLKGQVLVAAGIWSENLVQMPKIRSLYGASVRFQAHLAMPRIHVYAPYRQAVGFQLNKREVWFGDGTALIRKTWESERDVRIAATLKRGANMLETPQAKHRVNVGARPYVEGHKAGYFDRVSPHTWVSTGGAKNGTVLAAVQAARFIEEAKL